MNLPHLQIIMILFLVTIRPSQKWKSSYRLESAAGKLHDLLLLAIQNCIILHAHLEMCDTFFFTRPDANFLSVCCRRWVIVTFKMLLYIPDVQWDMKRFRYSCKMCWKTMLDLIMLKRSHFLPLSVIVNTLQHFSLHPFFPLKCTWIAHL